jgi:oligoribonuclease
MYFLFTDLEMSSLDERNGSILQLYAGMLSEDCERLEDGVGGTLPVPDDMDEDTRAFHANSGLLDMCAESKMTIGQLDDMLVDYMESFGCEPHDLERMRSVQLAGFSVHFDLRWIRHHMPRSSRYIHYRVLDLSGVRTVFQLAGFDLIEQAPVAHLAKADTIAAFDTFRKAVKLIKSMRWGDSKNEV